MEPDSVRSDSSGLASAQWTLGLAPGGHTLAVAAGAGILAVTATALDPAVAVATVELESRLVERAWAGQRIPLEVRLRRDTGIGLGGGLVTFVPGPSGGSATPDSTLSDPYGLATSVWRLGPTPGVYTMVVASGSVRLELSSRVLDPDSVVARVVPRSGDGQWGLVGKRLEEPVVVQVLDESEGPVPGALVSFAPEAGSGSVEPDSVRSDSAGLASALWTLGPAPGEQRLTVAAGGLTRMELTAVAQPDAGVCGRTRAVIEELLRLTGVAHCGDVTAGHLASVERMKLIQINLEKLRGGDFAGLSRLTHLWVVGNPLTQLPAGIFDDLESLEWLSLSSNQLVELPAGVFDNLPRLTVLFLTKNRLGRLDANVFAGLSALRSANLEDNQFAELPPGIFANLSGLKPDQAERATSLRTCLRTFSRGWAISGSCGCRVTV